MLDFNGIISNQLQHEQSNSQTRTFSKGKIRVNSSAVVLQVTPWLAGRSITCNLRKKAAVGGISVRTGGRGSPRRRRSPRTVSSFRSRVRKSPHSHRPKTSRKNPRRQRARRGQKPTLTSGNRKNPELQIQDTRTSATPLRCPSTRTLMLPSKLPP